MLKKQLVNIISTLSNILFSLVHFFIPFLYELVNYLIGFIKS